MAERQNSLVRAFKARPDPGTVDTVAPMALLDANNEAIRFMSDVGMEIHYAPYAARGMRMQSFLKCRMLAFMDEFEDIEDSVKLAKLQIPSLAEYRDLPEYQMMISEMKIAVQKLANEDEMDWLKRVGRRGRNNLDRFSRTMDPELMRDAGRASEAIVGRHLPVMGREQRNQNQVLRIPETTIRSIAEAFKDRGVVVESPAQGDTK